ncbi:chaperonin 10-like protein [Exophiala viscosa]|uniref:D-xylulose reductase n=1 Tax=Exophiala viscosa TaxID=2486360 RepID=A0AAN6DYR7_9EURO|nr:chaperonin 10-like protein [Exophiala viscosa]
MGDLGQESNPSFVLRAVKDVKLEDIPKPTITDPYDVIVHIGQTGICGSDVHYWQRGRIGDFILESPIVLGHESAGTVVDIGSKVKNLKVGDRVAIEPGVPCRHCDYCRSGSYNLCPDTVFAATPPHNGTLSKFYKTAADYCYPLADHLTLEDGALCEPVAVAVQVCKVGNVRPGQTVVVFGCGPIGLLVQCVAKAYAAKKVIGIDMSASRMELAKSVLKCADETFAPPRMPKADGEAYDADKESEWSAKVAAQIKDAFNLGEGPDVVIDATGAQSCIQTGVNLCKKGGTYVQAGMGKENIIFPITTACIRDLTIRGSIRYTAGVYSAAVDLVASGKVDPKVLITHRYSFEKAEEAFETVRKGGEHVLKVIIEGVKDN